MCRGPLLACPTCSLFTGLWRGMLCRGMQLHPWFQTCFRSGPGWASCASVGACRGGAPAVSTPPSRDTCSVPLLLGMRLPWALRVAQELGAGKLVDGGHCFSSESRLSSSFGLSGSQPDRINRGDNRRQCPSAVPGWLCPDCRQAGGLVGVTCDSAGIWWPLGPHLYRGGSCLSAQAPPREGSTRRCTCCQQSSRTCRGDLLAASQAMVAKDIMRSFF